MAAADLLAFDLSSPAYRLQEEVQTGRSRMSKSVGSHLERHLRPEELAVRWQTTPKTLANRRGRGQGPAFVNVGASVRYPMGEIVAYEAANRVQGPNAA